MRHRLHEDFFSLLPNFGYFHRRSLRSTLVWPEKYPLPHDGGRAMSGRHSSKRNQRSIRAKASRRRRAVGLGSSAGALLAFGLGPLAAAPAANADELDAILDPIINSLASIDPTLAADATSLLSTLDTALSGASSADPASAVSAQSTDLAQLYDQFIYEPAHTFDQEWINGTTFLGNSTVLYDNFINSLSPGTLLIGNGADGISAADPNGGAGGLIFGDGGTGWDSTIAGDNGGAGGVAFDGNGGD